MLRPFLAVALLLIGVIQLTAQDTLMYVYGTVKEFNTKKPIPQALVLMFDVDDPEHRVTVLTNSQGRYDLNITEERKYRISFGVVGHYNKSIVIDTTGPTKEQWVGGYGMNVDINLMPEVEGLDMSFGNEPFGYARFNPTTENFEWDVEYTQAMMLRHADLMEAYKARMGITE